jgi:hypothetical protein
VNNEPVKNLPARDYTPQDDLDPVYPPRPLSKRAGNVVGVLLILIIVVIGALVWRMSHD